MKGLRGLGPWEPKVMELRLLKAIGTINRITRVNFKVSFVTKSYGV